MLLGVAILGVGGYLYWNSTKSKKFAGYVSSGEPMRKKCCGHTSTGTDASGKTVYFCCDGNTWAPSSNNKACSACEAQNA